MRSRIGMSTDKSDIWRQFRSLRLTCFQPCWMTSYMVFGRGGSCCCCCSSLWPLSPFSAASADTAAPRRGAPPLGRLPWPTPYWRRCRSLKADMKPFGKAWRIEPLGLNFSCRHLMDGWRDFAQSRFPRFLDF